MIETKCSMLCDVNRSGIDAFLSLWGGAHIV